jgi:hypothetical protein
MKDIFLELSFLVSRQRQDGVFTPNDTPRSCFIRIALLHDSFGPRTFNSELRKNGDNQVALAAKSRLGECENGKATRTRTYDHLRGLWYMSVYRGLD